MRRIATLVASMVLAALVNLNTVFAQTADPCPDSRVSVVRDDGHGNKTRLCADPLTARGFVAISATISAIDGRPVSASLSPSGRTHWGINGLGGYGYGGSGGSPALQSFYGSSGMVPSSYARYRVQSEDSAAWQEGRRQVLDGRVQQGQLQGITDGLSDIQRGLEDVRKKQEEQGYAIEKVNDRSVPPTTPPPPVSPSAPPPTAGTAVSESTSPPTPAPTKRIVVSGGKE